MRISARTSLPLLFSFLAIMVIASCSRVAPAAPTQISDLEYTRAVETLVAALTQSVPQISHTEPAISLATETMEQEALPVTSTPIPTETLPPTSTPRPTETPLPTETATLALTETPTFTPEPRWQLMYSDDLKLGNWVNEKTDSFRLQYSQGGYMITNHLPKEIAYSVRNDQYQDVRLEIDVRRISGPKDGYFGLICNFVNGGNYYFFGIGADGWYGIGIKQAGQMRFLKESYDTKSVIQDVNKGNKIRAECLQGILTLTVNDVQLASVKDGTFSSGALGVGVGNRTLTGTEAVFSDFMVFQLEQPEE